MSESLPDPRGLDDVFFLKRSFPGLRDLWTEAIDWAPTIVTAVAVLVTPYVMVKMLDKNRPALSYLPWVLSQDRYVRALCAVALVGMLALALWQMFQLLVERRQRVVRLDLHEIECWPDHRHRYLLVRDVIGAQIGRAEQRSRWWVLRAKRPVMFLYVKRPGEETIEHVRVDWSRHDLISAVGSVSGFADGRDGNRVSADIIALLRRRRIAFGLPIEELPDAPVDLTAQSGVRLVGDRDQVVLTTASREVIIPGWAVRSATVHASAKGARFPLQLALELDPRCGEFHLLFSLGKGPEDEKIVQWFQLLAARFDKDAASVVG